MKISKLFIITFLATLLSFNAYSETTHSFQAGLSYSNSSSLDNTKTEYYTSNFAYYLSPLAVSDSEPFDELSFLQRSSNVQFSYTKASLETDSLVKGNVYPISVGGVFT